MAIETTLSEPKRVGKDLQDVLRLLARVQSALNVSAMALEKQNCEADADVASVLRYTVIDGIQGVVERLEFTVDVLRSSHVSEAESQGSEAHKTRPDQSEM